MRYYAGISNECTWSLSPWIKSCLVTVVHCALSSLNRRSWIGLSRAVIETLTPVRILLPLKLPILLPLSTIAFKYATANYASQLFLKSTCINCALGIHTGTWKTILFLRIWRKQNCDHVIAETRSAAFASTPESLAIQNWAQAVIYTS